MSDVRAEEKLRSAAPERPLAERSRPIRHGVALPQRAERPRPSGTSPRRRGAGRTRGRGAERRRGAYIVAAVRTAAGGTT